ncbi:MAG: pyridoxal phosphate-dependent aminotransferase [Hydrotalea sp.]|nr:pyridoxal phosphate-dependent aminotransferase [Hydrotalea sp.]
MNAIILNPNVGHLGSESAFAITARAEALKAEGRDIVNLSIGQPDYKTAPHIVEAAIKALRDGKHGYTPTLGIIPLRETIAGYFHRQYGARVSPDNVMVAPGSKMVMFMAITMLGGVGTDIIYPEPAYPIYRSLINYIGSQAVPLPLLEENGFAFRADEVLARCNEHTRLIIINNPANPTGGVATKTEIEKLIAGLQKFPRAMLLVDEIYSRLIYDDAKHISFLQYPEIYDRLILLDGLSKSYAMTGWRLGFGVWPREIMPDVARLAINSFSCVNAPTQYAAIAALDGDQSPVEEMRQHFDKRRKRIVALLNDVPDFSVSLPQGAFYVFPNIKKLMAKHGGDSQSWHKRLLEEAGVATVPGSTFGVHGEGYLRFSYSCSDDDIEKGLKMVRDFITAI